MMEENEIKKIKDFVEEFLGKMTIDVIAIEVTMSSAKNENPPTDSTSSLQAGLGQRDSIDLAITIEDPQMLIGQSGQTLFELTRLLKIILNKKLSHEAGSGADRQKDFYLTLDINDYKKKKVEYLEDLATTLADQVVKTKETKILPPMPSYERRIIHTKLSQRQDVITQSQGEGADRCVVIKPRD